MRRQFSNGTLVIHPSYLARILSRISFSIAADRNDNQPHNAAVVRPSESVGQVGLASTPRRGDGNTAEYGPKLYYSAEKGAPDICRDKASLVTSVLRLKV
jgi:hypothetical protein